MVNLLDLRYLIDCKKKVKELAQDSEYAQQILDWLNANPEMRDELSEVYVTAIKTVEVQTKP
ncbi:hypothetical protein QWI17_09310 [Gilvimarinus sp. SDUM040013]|uniref:Uncharacterized protein n=1 Tax=Gilvimarinus gilvus TaxID=3058038 RepID=A0ABU4S019_9GAMM|nr:hypothetical protein [Gilvimarinus sp. SDUM040013]MDO3386033.1 hypothetical protein [Gilvimarinus sp. SDUM040013]MDX6850486.1 hypothetical protein [Gilvimarinus sp. SDUM040013]